MPFKAASKTDTISISLPKTLARQMDREAKKRSMTRSELVRDALRHRIGWNQPRDPRVEAAIAEGLADVKAGRVSGPFSSVEEFKEHMKKRGV